MYINDDKFHRGHHIHTQIDASHHLVEGVVGSLPPANHNRTLTQGTMGDLTFEAVDDERDALIQQVVQVRGDTGHLRHHPNLKKESRS